MLVKSPSEYSGKVQSYFSSLRRSFVDPLPANPAARLLEIGCGDGSTSAYALESGKCGWCCGVELCEGPAAEARTKLNEVIVGDVEKLVMDLAGRSFDILILSEVLEHLRNPSLVLKKLRDVMRPGAIVLAGSPNVCHYGVLLMLLRGRWDYQREGVMDETHLRWFSPASYGRLFETAGYVIDHVGPAYPLRRKPRLANALLLGRCEYLFYPQIKLQAHCV